MEKEFTELINRHRGILFKVCNLYFNNEEDKKDLFQEMVLQLWKSYPGFRQQSLLTTWMYRVALNTAVSYFRKESRRPAQQPMSYADFNVPDISLLSEQNDQLGTLQLAVARLSKIEKALLICYLDDKSYQEISEILGISVSNVGVKLNRIKSKLEKIINTYHHEHK